MGEDSLMSDHVRSDIGECEVSWDARSSPMRAEAKKAVVHAENTTCFEIGDHDVAAILCPINSKRGKVTTLLVSGLVSL